VEGPGERHQFLTLMINAVEQAVIATDSTGRILHWNRFAEQLYGWRSEEVVGQNVADVLLPEESRDMGRAVVSALCRRETNTPGEWLLKRRDGSRVPVRTAATPILDDGGKVVGIVGVSWDVSETKRLQEELQALSRRLLAAQEAERRTIARELHDDFGQILTAVRLNLQTINRPGACDPAEHIAESIVLVDKAIERVRSLALELRPSILDDLGLVSALRWLLKRQGERAGFEGSVRVRALRGRLPSPVETCCFRVAQEALTNIARHAEARQVALELTAAEGEFELAVRDDGSGFDVRAASDRAARGESLGLLSMRERVSLAGGRMELESTPGSGTVLRARFPLSSGAA
jgi:PAS domain S-box-containing protein